MIKIEAYWIQRFFNKIFTKMDKVQEYLHEI